MANKVTKNWYTKWNDGTTSDSSSSYSYPTLPASTRASRENKWAGNNPYKIDSINIGNKIQETINKKSNKYNDGGNQKTYTDVNKNINLINNTNDSLALLGTLARVQIPFIKVTIGEYTFGIYDKQTKDVNRLNEAFKATVIKFPNYVDSLIINKINGQVNKYTLSLKYPVTENNDPNFFEKVFSSVSDTRKIVFSYGDLSMPTYIYKDEEAIITDVKTQFNASNPVISYTVNAISSAALLTAGAFNFPARFEKPSVVIHDLLKDSTKKLTEIFYGMKDLSKVDSYGLIAGDDKPVQLQQKNNTNILEYITYLVSCMTPLSDSGSGIKSGVYVLNVIDDTSDIFNGPYFTVKMLPTSSKNSNALQTYTIEMGYPSQNIVTDFSIVNNETYSIFYNYANTITDEEYTWRINDNGKFEQVYAPLISSANDNYRTQENDRSWWTSVTEYPIKAKISIMGLLRPALLMSYVRLKMYYYGKLHISSGLYVITEQIDTINAQGFKTQLSLVRVASDDTEDINISYSYDNGKIQENKKIDKNIPYGPGVNTGI